MKATAPFLFLALFSATALAHAQADANPPEPIPQNAEPAIHDPAARPEFPTDAGGRHLVAIGASISTLGPSFQLTTNITERVNVRLYGSGLGYSSTFTSNGFNANLKANLASIGVAADVYPFHRGFRISPGVLVVNNNGIRGSGVAAGGTEITLNDETYYAASANPVTGATPLTANARLNLHANRPSFTLTTGWGNSLHRGGHWAFPFEIGVAFIGKPTLTMSLSGWACADQAQTQCSDVASTTDPTAVDIQKDLATQIAKWQSDLDPLKTYPIVSFGVTYTFGARRRGAPRPY